MGRYRSLRGAGARGGSTQTLPWGRAFTVPLLGTGSAGREQWTIWGADDRQAFTGESAYGGFDGDLRSVYLGVDGQLSGEWMAGAAVSGSRAEAAYSFKHGEASSERTLRTDLTSVYAYLHGTPPNGWSMWGIGGLGAGDAFVRSDGPALADCGGTADGIGCRRRPQGSHCSRIA